MGVPDEVDVIAGNEKVRLVEILQFEKIGVSRHRLFQEPAVNYLNKMLH